MARQDSFGPVDKQALEDDSIIDHLVSTFGTVAPGERAEPPIADEPLEVYDQIRRTLTQHWEYDHRIFLRVD